MDCVIQISEYARIIVDANKICAITRSTPFGFVSDSIDNLFTSDHGIMPSYYFLSDIVDGLILRFEHSVYCITDVIKFNIRIRISDVTVYDIYFFS